MQQLRGRWKLIAGGPRWGNSREVTRAHLAAAYALTPLGEHRLKNVAQAIAVYRLEGEHVPPASSPDT